MKEALKLLTDEEAAKLVNEEELKARVRTPNRTASCSSTRSTRSRAGRRRSAPTCLREGVQRRPAAARRGLDRVDEVRAGEDRPRAVHRLGRVPPLKPSDLIPELQGRLPIRVELASLGVDDFVRILTEPDAALTTQYAALMETEGVRVEFAPAGVRRIAEIAAHVNERTENIGARRLHTVMERLLERVSYEASEQRGTAIAIDAAYVDAQLGDLAKDEDLSRYIL